MNKIQSQDNRMNKIQSQDNRMNKIQSQDNRMNKIQSHALNQNAFFTEGYQHHTLFHPPITIPRPCFRVISNHPFSRTYAYKNRALLET